MTSHGYGNSMYKLSSDDRIEALKFSNFSVFVNGFNMAFLKISIGMALLRIGLGKTMNTMIWISIFISVCCNAMVIFGSLLFCRPMEAIWNKGLPTGTYECWPKTYNIGFSYTQTGMHIFVITMSILSLTYDHSTSRQYCNRLVLLDRTLDLSVEDQGLQIQQVGATWCLFTRTLCLGLCYRQMLGIAQTSHDPGSYMYVTSSGPMLMRLSFTDFP